MVEKFFKISSSLYKKLCKIAYVITRLYQGPIVYCIRYCNVIGMQNHYLTPLQNVLKNFWSFFPVLNVLKSIQRIISG